jgi:uncharacterized protein (DUF924 family)
MDHAILDAAHDFWFGPLPELSSFPHDRFPIWFGGGPEVDAQITARFAGALATYGTQPIDIATLTPRQQVGLIVLLDQFSRNIHRNSAEAYRTDPLARRYADAIADAGLDRFAYIERVFLTLPFGHSEDVADQRRAVATYARTVEPFVPADLPFYKAGRIQSQKYLGIIERFGRFPHRNALLGRETTAEEAEFMATVDMRPF